MSRALGRTTLSLLTLLLAGHASAIGLGELSNQPVLGEAIRLEVGLLGLGKQPIDASCFRLAQSAGDDFPWLRKATFSVRRGPNPVLEIRTEVPLREPLMQMTIQLGCGHEVSRSYMLLASPGREVSPSSVSSTAVRSETARDAVSDTPVVRPRLRSRAAPPVADELPVRLQPRKREKVSQTDGVPDRLLLSGGSAEVGEPSLRLATELQLSIAAKDAQRDILRLEYRMLMALHEQASSQMAAAEKLRNMEGALAELQARAGEFAQRVEKDVASPAVVPTTNPPSQANPPVVATTAPATKVVASESVDETPWTLYGLGLGVLLGLGGWFGWRRYNENRESREYAEPEIVVPELQVDPKREEEREELGGIDLPVEPAAMGMPMQVDFELGGQAQPAMVAEPAEAGRPLAQDSVLSINATTLDEHFEANPVMELADIMLSFGRVKGAAQALQEFIDHNPEEALQPWIRLMDVYRMAGMRNEFENVARNLNQHFNVEVQPWDSGVILPDAEELPQAPRPQSLEDMPRLMNTVLDLWGSGDVVGYLYQLLRDNRGGQRQGFALPVVDDILFLIELKETANRMERESKPGA